jgi:2-polyprenyl-3-methyl-5-hydroxy-6-metoxy-1,4-benzoquinol methylase
VKALTKLLKKILQKIRLGQVSEPQRFNCDDQEAELWQARAREAANLLLDALIGDGVVNEELRVADFGCGDQKLKRVLTRTLPSPVEYFGYDLHPQSNEVEFCDFETTAPAGPFDAIFCLGLFEYIKNLDHLISRIRHACRYAIVSFVVIEAQAYSEEEIRKRGWVWRYSPDELSTRLTASGFTIRKQILINNNTTAIWLLKVEPAKRPRRV